MNKQEGKIRVTKLAEDFNIVYSNKKVLERQKYNETTVRQKFIDPFFEALGWNIKSYDEVFLEYPQTREDDSKGRADYAFTLGDGKTFFVEAKKPSENLELNSKHALQARLYAFNASHPVVILTDFEEFFVYLGRGHEPKPGDKVNTSLIAELCCKYTEYADKWDMLWDAFSRESVMAGSLDKLPGVKKDSKGSKTVDAIFLADIEQWRKALAVNLHGNNPNLSRRALNETTQKTIDRIIFLRICEDREIENYGALRKLADKPSVYKALCKLFADADTRYNSGLFHFKEEKGRGNADSSHLNLHIDDEPLQAMILRLYFPGGPYAFAVMPADILGQVYERFLGKVIEIKPDGSVDVEIKPEVKKAGGVFYTPEYIVSYIVQNTVGKLLEKKKPADIAKLKILDPACGSGAFLIKAYQYLLDWHLAYYIKNKTPTWAKEKRIAKDERPLIDGTESKWQLTLLERKRILLAHIHGVDIDPQAVEVTRLSLLLKCLEGETRRTLQMGLFDHAERILPDLDKNIKCGNSLIGRDFYENMQAQLFDREAKLMINAFDWQTEFEDIMGNGGFDVVIGNPPYSYIISTSEQEYFSAQYRHQDYQKDLYLLFLERYQLLLKRQGLLGVIVSNTWLQSVTLRKIRQHLTGMYRWLNILHLPEKVFDAVVDTHVLIFQKEPQSNSRDGELTVYIRKDSEITLSHLLQLATIPSNGDPINIVATKSMYELASKIAISTVLDDICKITQGAKPFQVGKGRPKQTREIVDLKEFVSTEKRNDTYRPLLRGSLINKYKILWDDNYWISFGEWLAEPRYSANYEASEKIVIRQTGDSLIATLDNEQFIVRDNLYTIVNKYDQPIELKYILGLINSSLLNWYYQEIMNPEKGEALAQVKRSHVAQLPIRTIDPTNKDDKALHDKIVKLVETILSHHKELQAPGLDSQEKRSIERDIAATDTAIDHLVYQLYGLNDAEIKIVEDA